MKSSRSVSIKLAAAAVALVAAGTASVAQARSDVFFSVGANVAPGVSIGVSNAPPVYYAPPVYMQPQPVYVQPAPVYVQPQPVFVQPGYGYVRPAPVYGVNYFYGAPRKHRHGHHRHWN